MRKTDIYDAFKAARQSMRSLEALVGDKNIKGPDDVAPGSREIATQQYLDVLGQMAKVAEFLGLEDSYSPSEEDIQSALDALI